MSGERIVYRSVWVRPNGSTSGGLYGFSEAQLSHLGARTKNLLIDVGSTNTAIIVYFPEVVIDKEAAK